MNLTLSNKNPFSTFDFLGYLFPGALCLGLFYILTNGMDETNGGFLSHIPALVYAKAFVKSQFGIGVFLMVLVSYVIGHLLSYISSITVELYYTWFYGYPTRYLLRKSSKRRKYQYLLNSHLGVSGMLGHYVVCILLLPLVIGHFVFERFFHMKAFIGRSLDDKLINSIRDKVSVVSGLIGYGNARVSDPDVHRVVMHYVYEHCQMHQVKFDNYVSLYGLLRSVTLVFCLAFHFMLIRLYLCQEIPTDSSFDVVTFVSLIVVILLVVCTISWFCAVKYRKSEKRQWRIKSIQATDYLLGILVLVACAFIAVQFFMSKSYDNKVYEVVQLCCMGLATYVSYLGFAKFYRRFTLENYMALLTIEHAKPVDNMIKLKTEDPITITIDHPTNLTSEIFRFLAERSKSSK